MPGGSMNMDHAGIVNHGWSHVNPLNRRHRIVINLIKWQKHLALFADAHLEPQIYTLVGNVSLLTYYK
jgi:hypothetical protein